MEERNFVEVENLNGEKEKVEIFAQVNSERDNKTYVLLTPDETIGEKVNVAVGYIYEEDGKTSLELVENPEELNYAFSLVQKVLRGGN